MKKYFQTWWFGIFLGVCLIGFEVITLLLPILSTPNDFRWLGAGIFNTGDMAVYLNYLAQGKDSILISNLYNNLIQSPRFDLFWSTGGLLVRWGLTPLWAHEILRWISTLVLGLAVYATAKAVTKTESHARVASFLIISGLSTGWLYDVWMGLTAGWTHRSPATADLASEFAIAPTVLGGAHMILSLALQLLIVRWIWESILGNKKSFFYGCLATFVLSAFHPYYIPLIGLITVITFVLNRQSVPWQASLSKTLLINLSMLPATLYYFWIFLNDAGFRTHQTNANILPLDAWYFWLVMLLPFFIALVWMIVKSNFNSNKWVVLWITTAVLCMLLPFPWTRKFTQGLLPALIILTLPFWLTLADKLQSKNIIVPLKACLVIALFFPYIHLFQTQGFMATDPYWSKNFYKSESLFEAWKFAKNTSSPDDLILTSDQWSNYWTPVYTSRKVWIGHEHETPDFKNRINAYQEWTNTNDQNIFQNYLKHTPVALIIAADPTETDRFQRLINHDRWFLAFKNAQTSVWKIK